MAWLGTWAKRIELTIADTNVDSDLSNFPVLVYLSAASGQGDVDVSCVFDELASDANRKKIAVTTSNGTTQCYVEIERWDNANEKAWLWVKVPSILASGGATLYLYYDSSQDDNTTYVGDTTDAAAQSVWDSDFVAVYHMAQDPNGDGAGAIKDSTSNGYHGTPSGSMTTADLVDGLIGKGIEFDGTDDCVDIGDTDLLDGVTGATWEVVAKTTTGEVDRVLVSRWATDVQFRLWMDEGNDKWQAIAYTDNATQLIVQPGLIAPDDDWQYIAAIFDDTDLYLYVDLGDGGSDTDVGAADGLKTSAGGSIIIGATQTPDKHFDNIICEIRISKTARSAAWIKATYYSNTDAIVTFGEEETAEQTFIEDASLDLSVYGRQVDDFQSFLRAHDGIELHDLQAALEVFGLSKEDFPASLIAAHQSTDDLGTGFEAWATKYRELAGVFDAKGQRVENLPSQFWTAKAGCRDLASYLEVVDGTIMRNLSAYLAASDGLSVRDFGLYLKAIRSVPAFRSITAQRVSSVVHEVS